MPWPPSPPKEPAVGASGRAGGEKISRRRRIWLQVLYILAAIMWILLIFVLVFCHSHLGLRDNIVGYVILSVPILVFALGFLAMKKDKPFCRSDIFKGDVLAVTLLFLGLLFNGSNKKGSHYTNNIMMVASVLVLMSLIDICLGPKANDVYYVIRSIFQTCAITLLIYVIFVRFTSGLSFNTSNNPSLSLIGNLNCSSPGPGPGSSLTNPGLLIR